MMTVGLLKEKLAGFRDDLPVVVAGELIVDLQDAAAMSIVADGSGIYELPEKGVRGTQAVALVPAGS